jgi:protein gp37
MADRSSIEWTDATWNPITGCSVVSPGCTHCYAMRLAGTRLAQHPSRAGLTRETKAGPVWTGEVRINWDWIDQPLHWAKPRNIFVCAHGDLFHEGVPDEDIAQIYGVMIAAHHLRHHTLQVLTKRPNRARDLLTSNMFWDQAMAVAGSEIMDRTDPLNRRSDDARATCGEYDGHNPPPGIWLGVSAEDQRRADERVPDLLSTPAAVRFISAEPLLGPIDFTSWLLGLDWIIVGGESGTGARPMHPHWARSIRDQCADADVPFFFKQWGAWLPWEPEHGPCWVSQNGRCEDHHALFPVDIADDPPGWDSGLSCAVDGVEHAVFQKVGKKAAGRLLDGREHNDVPRARNAGA